MIEYKGGDMFFEYVEAYVNPVNCAGVMGKGLALQFKYNCPNNFKAYRKAYKNGEIQPGKMFVYDIRNKLPPMLDSSYPWYIINFPTKRHWKDNSRIDDIEKGLDDLVNTIREVGINSIAIPMLGCGEGGLNWDDVKPMIEKAVEPLDKVRVIVFEGD